MFSKKEENLIICAELHPQHQGDMAQIEQMIRECSQGGADVVKVQVYDTHDLHCSLERRYLELDEKELAEIQAMAEHFKIGFMASVFGPKNIETLRLSAIHSQQWVKIAARSGDDVALVKEVQLQMPTAQVIVSNPSDEVRALGNIFPLYTVRKYPTLLEDLQMPMFIDYRDIEAEFAGYSDHTIGIAASLKAISYGAQYLEKHYTLDKSKQCRLEQAHVCSMDYNDLQQIRKIGDAIRTIR